MRVRIIPIDKLDDVGEFLIEGRAITEANQVFRYTLGIA